MDFEGMIGENKLECYLWRTASAISGVSFPEDPPRRPGIYDDRNRTN
jgi:hypothetical protein